MTALVLNPDFLIEDEGGAQLPWIQPSNYQPRSLKDDSMRLCLSESSFEMLSPDQIGPDDVEIIEATWSDEGPDQAFVIKDARWIILSRPKTNFAQNKDDGSIVSIYRGMKFGSEWKSVARLYLGLMIGDRIVLDEDGQPQIFTLKLTGLKTQWIAGSEEKTIEKLNKALRKHYDIKRGWITHLVSNELAVHPRKFESALKKESSLGVMIGFAEEDKAKPLSEESQKIIFDLVNSDEFKKMVADPFGIEGQEPGQKSLGAESMDDADVEAAAEDDIAY